ncbi:MAG TPA: PilZ domain-containing protein [Polyangiaceae bacterium]|nr:PilZ domain-containing protein [Polyangiaceae bacterium]
MQEKRRHQRVAVQISVACTGPKGEVVEGVAVDLSVGGLYIQAPSAPPFGAEVSVSGAFPGGAGLKFPAVVRWTKPDGFGVQFGLLGARETHALAAIVQKGRA